MTRKTIIFSGRSLISWSILLALFITIIFPLIFLFLATSSSTSSSSMGQQLDLFSNLVDIMDTSIMVTDVNMVDHDPVIGGPLTKNCKCPKNNVPSTHSPIDDGGNKTKMTFNEPITTTMTGHDDGGGGGGRGSKYLMESLAIFNQIGLEDGYQTDFRRFEHLFADMEKDDHFYSLQNRLGQSFSEIKKLSQKFPHVNRPSPPMTPSKSSRSTKIIVATMACGERGRGQAMTMIKSAKMASQDAHLHLIVFSDRENILELGGDLLLLKWTVAQLSWTDLTFELQLESFPNDDGTKWRDMWQPCSTQRLFFPSLLPHVDSLIYLDADTLVVSNLTEIWDIIGRDMRDRKLAAMASNTEYPARGWYNTKSRVPHYGHGGLNAGVMLMNLTQMRTFHIEPRTQAAYTLYKEKIYLADQDLYNIIFHSFPEKLLPLSCTYNFNWVHCGDNVRDQNYPKKCHLDPRPGQQCFCKDVMTTGLHIVHGNCKTFFKGSTTRHYPFLIEVNRRFQQLNLLEHSIWDMVQELKNHFETLSPSPCFDLSGHVMYKNIENYLNNIYHHH